MAESQPGSLFEPGPKTEDTPIYEQLVAEATYPQLIEEPESDEPDPLVGEP